MRAADNRELWARTAERFNDTFRAPLNSHRAAVGLGPVVDVQSHIFTGRPWLEHLGIGSAHELGTPGAPTPDSLASALERTLRAEFAARAGSVATEVRRDGADVAARRLMTGPHG